MKERRLLHGAMRVCCLLVLLSTLVSAQFVCEIWHQKDAKDKSLTFGLVDQFPEGTEDGIQPFPPDGPVGTLYFLGRAPATESDRPTDFFRLSDDFRLLQESPQSATWTLKSGTNTTLVFKFQGGQAPLPAGSVLKIGDTVIKEGTEVTIEANQDYDITYQPTADTAVAPTQPENISLQVVKAPGATVSVKVDDSTQLVGKVPGASIEKGVLTYTVQDTEGNQVKFDIVNEVNGVQSAPASVIITFTDGIALRLLSDPRVTLKAGDKEGGATTVVQYEVAVGTGVKAESLKMTLTLPAWTTMKEDPFPYKAVVTCGDQTVETTVSPEDKSKLSFTLSKPEKAVTLTVELTAEGSKAESRSMALDAVAGEVRATVDGPYVYIEGSATMDLDDNTVVDIYDAIMFYNFVNQNGVRFPQFFNGEAGLKKLTVGIEVDPVAADRCRNLLQALPPYLDYDGDGGITIYDAIMFYNFVNQNGVRFPQFFNGEAGLKKLTVGIEVDSTHSTIARDKFQQLVK